MSRLGVVRVTKHGTKRLELIMAVRSRVLGLREKHLLLGPLPCQDTAIRCIRAMSSSMRAHCKRRAHGLDLAWLSSNCHKVGRVRRVEHAGWCSPLVVGVVKRVMSSCVGVCVLFGVHNVRVTSGPRYETRREKGGKDVEGTRDAPELGLCCRPIPPKLYTYTNQLPPRAAS